MSSGTPYTQPYHLIIPYRSLRHRPAGHDTVFLPEDNPRYAFILYYGEIAEERYGFFGYPNGVSFMDIVERFALGVRRDYLKVARVIGRLNPSVQCRVARCYLH